MLAAKFPLTGVTRAVALEVTNVNFLITHFTMIYENIISLHVSLIIETVCQCVDVSTSTILKHVYVTGNNYRYGLQ